MVVLGLVRIGPPRAGHICRSKQQVVTGPDSAGQRAHQPTNQPTNQWTDQPTTNTQGDGRNVREAEHAAAAEALAALQPLLSQHEPTPGAPTGGGLTQPGSGGGGAGGSGERGGGGQTQGVHSSSTTTTLWEVVSQLLGHSEVGDAREKVRTSWPAPGVARRGHTSPWPCWLHTSHSPHQLTTMPAASR